MKVDENDLVEVHRLPKPKPKKQGDTLIDQQPPIIVQFFRHDTKTQAIMNSIEKEQEKSVLEGLNKGKNQGNKSQRIYFSDHLTLLYNRKLLMDARHRWGGAAQYVILNGDCIASS